MRLYLDTADRAAAEPLLATGLFAGLTTNPTILDRAGLGVDDIPDIYAWAHEAGAREIFFQTWGSDTQALVERGRSLYKLGDDVVVKVVASKEGAAACATLAAEGIPTLLTAVYAPGQVMVAAAAGATYVAPYLGKLDDAGLDGIAEVTAMQELLVATGSTCKILLASVRSVPAMVALARRGVGAFTMATPVAEAFFDDELTAAAIAVFDDVIARTAAGVSPEDADRT
jgi:TalC/MipB family fructose-6-phosphate aldolase